MTRPYIPSTSVLLSGRWPCRAHPARLPARSFHASWARGGRSIPNGPDEGKGVLRLEERLDEREIFEDTLIKCLRDTERVHASRRLEFSPEALAEAACDALSVSHVTAFRKLAEGESNRVFLLTLDTGAEVVARLTFGSQFPPHLSNASEAATLTFLREALGVPVPRVYAWSSLRRANHVGAPYMLAERVPGVELTKRLRALRESPDHLITQLVQIRQKLARTRFARYGALYFQEDVPEELRGRPLLAGDCEVGRGEGWERRWALGPSLHRVFWMGERGRLDVDRGPWKDVPSLARSLASIESAYIKAHGTPPPHTSSLYRPGSQSDPLAHLRALKQDTQLAPYIAPPEPEACVACLLHPDFHAGNVFVPEEGELRVRGIIDWQGAGVGPLYQQMKTPDFLSLNPLGTSTSNTSTLADSYRSQLAASSPALAKAQEYNASLWTALLSAPLEVWPANLALLRYVLLTVYRNWGELFAPHHGGRRCPISFTPEEEREIEEQWNDRLALEELEDRAVQAVGVGVEGWVNVKDWERKRARSREALEEVVKTVKDGDGPELGRGELGEREVRRVWPFREDDGSRLL